MMLLEAVNYFDGVLHEEIPPQLGDSSEPVGSTCVCVCVRSATAAPAGSSPQLSTKNGSGLWMVNQVRHLGQVRSLASGACRRRGAAARPAYFVASAATTRRCLARLQARQFLLAQHGRASAMPWPPVLKSNVSDGVKGNRLHGLPPSSRSVIC